MPTGNSSNSHAPISDVAAALRGNIRRYVEEWLPGGKVVGHEYVVRNPMRADKTPGSFCINVDTGAWGDFASGETGGDLVSLYAALNSRNNGQAADELNERYRLLPGSQNSPNSGRKSQTHSDTHKNDSVVDMPTLDAPKSVAEVIMPVPVDAPEPPGQIRVNNNNVWESHDIDHWYAYRNAAGELLGYIVRVDATTKLHSKEIRPLTYVEKDGKGWWGRKSFPVPRPLYGLDLLAQKPRAKVLIVEGEKCADAGNAILGKDWVVVTWPGGAKVAHKADWSPLKGRDCTYWPDNDEAGNVAAQLIREKARAKVMQIPEGMPEKWDIADAANPASARPVSNISEFIQECLQPVDTQIEATPVKAIVYPDLKYNGKPEMTLPNVLTLLNEFGISAKYNAITKDVDHDIPGKNYHGDNVQSEVLAYLTGLAVMNGLTKKDFNMMLGAAAFANTWNPVAEWIMSEPWDGESRLDELLRTIEVRSGYPPDLKDILIRRWMISAVAAEFDREFRSRGVLVLQSDQGMGKTTWLRTIAHDTQWFGDGLMLDPTNKDSVTEAVSKWIVELGELEGTFKRNLPRLKAFMTRTKDELRRPYAPVFSKYARRTVFAGTVNELEFLLDETGNDRFWCIPCANIIIPSNIPMQQLWAEVKELYDAGEQWWLTAEENRQLQKQNFSFEQSHPVEDLIDTRFDWDAHEMLWDRRTVTEFLMDAGMRQPNKSETTKAGLVIRNRTGQNPPKGGGGKPKKYLLPPLKDKFKNVSNEYAHMRRFN